jgi:hypothetical protein
MGIEPSSYEPLSARLAQVEPPRVTIAAVFLACGLHCGEDSTYGNRTDRARQKAFARSRSGRPPHRSDEARFGRTFDQWM